MNTNTALREIYSHNANVQRSSYYNIFSHYFKAPCTMTVITAHEHGRKLKFISQGLSDSAISAMEEHILKNVRAFCQKLSCRDGFEIQGQQEEKQLSIGW